MPFEQKTVLVTGAARGLGRACALAFAAEGAFVALNDINPDGLARLAAEITQHGGAARDYHADVSKKFPIQAMVNQVEDDRGGIDILVNNARAAPQKSLLDMDEWDWRRTVDVNLTGAFLMMQVVGRVMRSAGRGGSMLNLIETVPALERDFAAYGAAQQALNGLTQRAALELGEFGIRVNGIRVPVNLPQEARQGITDRVLWLTSESALEVQGQVLDLP
jgi:NAD(P)-dependent dehydrogenase (short-subunit alcohol dehydrogenase family)